MLSRSSPWTSWTGRCATRFGFPTCALTPRATGRSAHGVQRRRRRDAIRRFAPRLRSARRGRCRALEVRLARSPKFLLADGRNHHGPALPLRPTARGRSCARSPRFSAYGWDYDQALASSPAVRLAASATSRLLNGVACQREILAGGRDGRIRLGAMRQRGRGRLRRRDLAGRGAGGQISWLTGTMRARRSTPFSGSSKSAMNAPRENDGRSPDELNDPDEQRRVHGYVCTVGQTLYAFEHTGIEPFLNQIRVRGPQPNRSSSIRIMKRFDHRSDREFWNSIVPVDASAGLTANDVGPVQDALIKWIETNAGRSGRPALRPTR